jgi:muramoyltetrapeptide carboxypeptidase
VEPTVLQVLEERLAALGVPVLAGLPIGHGKRNAPVPLGAIATLDADTQELIIEA